MKPTTLVLEPTNLCNLNCPFCMVGVHNEYNKKHKSAAHNFITRPKGFITGATLNKVIKEASLFGIKKIQFHFQGEPLMHKRYVPMVIKLKKAGFYVQFFTNGLLLTPNAVNRLVMAGVDLIRFSIDGLTQDVYEKNRVGGDCKKAFDNLQKMVRRAKGSKTKIEWQLIVLSNNEHQIAEAVALSKKIGVKLFLKTYAVTDKSLVPKNKKYIRKLVDKPCTTIYRQFCVYWNGDIVPCCYDTDGRNVVGNIHRDSLLNIWKSATYNKFRSSVCTLVNEPKICKTCLYWKN